MNSVASDHLLLPTQFHDESLIPGCGEHSWFKSDSCYAKDRNEPGSKGEIDAIHLYELMRDGFNRSGYPVWWALCGWSPLYAGPNKYPQHPVGNALANSARIGPDTGGGWTAVLANLQSGCRGHCSRLLWRATLSDLD